MDGWGAECRVRLSASADERHARAAAAGRFHLPPSQMRLRWDDDDSAAVCVCTHMKGWEASLHPCWRAHLGSRPPQQQRSPGAGPAPSLTAP